SADVYRGLFQMYKGQGRSGMEKVLSRLNTSLNRAAPAPEKPDQEPPPGSPAEAAKARAMLLVLRDDPELVRDLLPLVSDKLLQPGGRDGLASQARFFFATWAARARQLDAAERLYRSCLEKVDGRRRSPEAQVYGGLLRVLWQAHKYEAIVDVCQQGLTNAR